MGLVKILVALVVLHLAMGFTQMSVTYFTAERPDYGEKGILSHTPIASIMPLDDADRVPGGIELTPGAFDRLIGTVNAVGDMTNGLATFNYAFLTDIGSDAGLPYMLVMAFRIFSALIWVALAVRLLYILFDSNILTSPLGLGVVGLGVAGTAATSIVGAVVN